MKKKYFGTDGIRGRVGSSLISPDFMLKLGWAVGTILRQGSQGKVLIGKDTRISGYMFESALEAGLSASGMNIHLLGPMPTPAVAYLTRTLRAEAGIVISASHNLFEDNGIKFFSKEGFKLSDTLEAQIEAVIDQPMRLVSSKELGKASRLTDGPGRYIEFCKSTVPSRLILSGLKIVVDCAQGATYQVAPSVFRELGAKVIELATDPDGLNINKLSGSTSPEILQKIVKAEGADVGVAFDGDGDRVVMVDHKGEKVNGDELLYIMVKHRLTQSAFTGGVVGTLMSNFGLEKSLSSIKVPFKRAKVGDRYVMEMLKQSNWQLGGESSGHIVNLSLTTTGDGIISALQALCAMAQAEKSLHDLKQGMMRVPQKLINVPITRRIDLENNQNIKQVLSSVEQQLKGKGRVLLRPSGTEPVIRIMVEGEEETLVDHFIEELVHVVKEAV